MTPSVEIRAIQDSDVEVIELILGDELFRQFVEHRRMVSERKLALVAAFEGTIMGVLALHESTHSIVGLMTVQAVGSHSRDVVDSFCNRVDELADGDRWRELTLTVPRGDELVEDALFDLGFFAKSAGGRIPNCIEYVRIARRVLVDDAEWVDLAAQLGKLGVSVVSRFPGAKNFRISGVEAILNGSRFLVPRKKFEAMVSPAVLTWPERVVSVAPIREGYAESLLGDLGSKQRALPFRGGAFLKAERAYFCSSRYLGAFEEDGLIAFYVTGSTQKRAVGMARITSVRTVRLSDAQTTMSRFGVLAEKDWVERFGARGEACCVTFAGYRSFAKSVPISEFRQRGWVGPGNMVRSYALSAQQSQEFLRSVFQNEA